MAPEDRGEVEDSYTRDGSSGGEFVDDTDKNTRDIVELREEISRIKNQIHNMTLNQMSGRNGF